MSTVSRVESGYDHGASCQLAQTTGKLATCPTVAAAASLLFFLLAHVPFIRIAFPSDEGDNLLGGWLIRLGQVPYRDFFSQHMPLGFFYSALFEFLAEGNWVVHRWSVGLFGLVVLGFLQARLHRAGNSVLFAAVVVFTLLWPFYSVLYCGFMLLNDNLGAYACLFLFVMMLHAWNNPLTGVDWFACGLSIVAAILANPFLLFPVLVWAACMGGAVGKSPQPWRPALGSLFGGVAIPSVLTMSYFLATGSLADAWRWVVGFNQEVFAQFHDHKVFAQAVYEGSTPSFGRAWLHQLATALNLASPAPWIWRPQLSRLSAGWGNDWWAYLGLAGRLAVLGVCVLCVCRRRRLLGIGCYVFAAASLIRTNEGFHAQHFRQIELLSEAIAIVVCVGALAGTRRGISGACSRSSSDAPKGQNNKAQGNALGREQKPLVDLALKGRNSEHAPRLCRPFRAWIRSCLAIGPRALPWALLFQPFRLKRGKAISPVRVFAAATLIALVLVQGVVIAKAIRSLRHHGIEWTMHPTGLGIVPHEATLRKELAGGGRLLCFPTDYQANYELCRQPASFFYACVPWTVQRPADRDLLCADLRRAAAENCVVCIDRKAEIWGHPFEFYAADVIAELERSYVEIEPDVYVSRQKHADTPSRLKVLALPLEPDETIDLDWTGTTATSDGGHPQLVFALDRSRFVHRVELHFTLTNANRERAFFQTYWMQFGKNFFGDGGRRRAAWLPTGNQTRVFSLPVEDVIDRIRIDPDIQPCRLELQAIKLIVPAAVEATDIPLSLHDKGRQ